jgi:hypothetical protein
MEENRARQLVWPFWGAGRMYDNDSCYRSSASVVIKLRRGTGEMALVVDSRRKIYYLGLEILRLLLRRQLAH